MARYTDAVCKMCRREGEKLFLKGAKCSSGKCPIDSRNFPPGQHGKSRRSRPSDYGSQLREKQKCKRIYGLLEKQFRTYFEKAHHEKGVTGEVLLQKLESRFDNVIYRMGFAASRAAARQLITHKHFTINGKVVNIPSYLLGKGDTINVREASKKMEVIHLGLKKAKQKSVYSWLDVDKANLAGTFLDNPSREEIPVNVNENLIVELYSK
ncbi:30S ribosomal protein S4 [bacterium]|nr:30S ribosomal protein S4 [bacterium]